MKRFLLLLSLLPNLALADAPVVWSGTTAKWLPSGLRVAGMCKTDANGIQTPYTTDGIVKMSSGVPGAASSGTDFQAPLSTSAAVSTQFVTGFTAPNTFTRAQPAFTDVSGSVAATQMPALTGDVTTSAGAVATTITNLAVTNAMVANSTIDLTAKVTGVLPYANGGSNAATAWTAGSVLFAGASAFAQDNANFFWDDTNNFLGVGNTTPGAPIDIRSNGGTAELRLSQVNTNGPTRFMTGVNGYLTIQNSAKNIITSDAAGHFGLATGAANGPANLDTVIVANQASELTHHTFAIQGTASQTGDLLEVYTSGSTVGAKIDITGKGFFANFRNAGCLSGIGRFDGSGDETCAELSSDVTTSGSNATTVAKIQGTTVSGTTGTTNVVFSTSPTMSNPVVGTQSLGDSSTKAASTAFVQAALAQLNPAAAVFAASTANITGTYTNAVGGVCVADTFTVTATGALTIDGQTPGVGKRVLLKNQTSGFQNGVWDVTVAGSVGVSPILTRSLDWDNSADMNAGNLIPVINGTANANTVWYQSAAITTCSSDSQVYTQFTGGASGGDTVAVLTKTASYSVLIGDFSTSTKRLILECNASASMTVTLPALSTAGGYTIVVKNIGTAECDVAPNGSDKIDGDTILQLMPGGIPQSGNIIIGGSQWDIAS